MPVVILNVRERRPKTTSFVLISASCTRSHNVSLWFMMPCKLVFISICRFFVFITERLLVKAFPTKGFVGSVLFRGGGVGRHNPDIRTLR